VITLEAKEEDPYCGDEVVDAKRVEDRATCAIVEGALRGGALW